jgi:pilus assembly protein CpaB
VNRRVLGLLVAVVLAAVATAAIYFYVQRADERAADDFELRQVYVATQEIVAGTPASEAIAQALIESRDIPATAVADGAIGSLDQIQGQIAVTAIVPGQQIVAASFGDSAAAGSTATDIEVPEGLQAISVDLSVIPGVAGFIDAGDRLSVISLIQGDGAAAPPPPEGEQAPNTPATGLQARYVVQNSLVLAVGQRVSNYDENGNFTGKSIRESNDNYIFTLAVTPEEAEKLVFAKTQSTLWATLLPSVDEEEGEELEPVTTPGANADNLFQ